MSEAQSVPVQVWCPCFETPEPEGNWLPPDDAHSDTHVLDWLVGKAAECGEHKTNLVWSNGAPLGYAPNRRLVGWYCPCDPGHRPDGDWERADNPWEGTSEFIPYKDKP